MEVRKRESEGKECDIIYEKMTEWNRIEQNRAGQKGTGQDIIEWSRADWNREE